MLSLMLDRVTHALITDLAATAGVSRSAWCRDVLEQAAHAELARQDQAAETERQERQRRYEADLAERRRQENIDRMQRNQGRTI